MQRIPFLLAFGLSVAVAAQEPSPDEDAATEVPPGAAGAQVSDAPPEDDSGAVYRRRSEDGSIEFSDSPSPDAERVQIRETQTIEAPPPPSFVYEREQAAPERYTRVEIMEPSDDAQVRENTGNLTVSVAVEPGLSGSDQVVIMVDGQEAASGTQTSFNLTNLDRGTHRLTAVIRSREGKTMASSPAVTFHMLRYFEGPPKPAPKPPPSKAK
ncbi:MAG TPA: Ig-like domain-containing protein [Gammaproteobacteria bacterium]